jgi:hypothetical protein
LLDAAGAPSFYDKLLSVPILNLSVRAIDSFTRTAVVQRLRDRTTLGPGALNWIHIGGWTRSSFRCSRRAG